MFPLNLKMFRNVTIDNAYRTVEISLAKSALPDQGSFYPGFSFPYISFLQTPSEGTLQGGSPSLISSFIDFSFILSLIAYRYFLLGPPCFHLISIFLLDLFHFVYSYQHMPFFILPLYFLGNLNRVKNSSFYG